MPKGKILSEYEKGQIKAYLTQKFPFRWIGAKINRSEPIVVVNIFYPPRIFLNRRDNLLKQKHKHRIF